MTTFSVWAGKQLDSCFEEWRKALPIFTRGWKVVEWIWIRRPSSQHPIVVAAAIGLTGTLLIPFSARYAEVQRSIQVRTETLEELVQYSATVMNSFRSIDQANQQFSRHHLADTEKLKLEIAIQEATNRMHSSEHVLEAHIAFRFQASNVGEAFKAHVDLVRDTLNKLSDSRRPYSEKQQALQQYWANSMDYLNVVVSHMDVEINLPTYRVYKYVLLGGASIVHEPTRTTPWIGTEISQKEPPESWWSNWFPRGKQSAVVPNPVKISNSDIRPSAEL